MLPWFPYCCNIVHIVFLFTMSNAFQKSTEATYTFFFLLRQTDRWRQTDVDRQKDGQREGRWTQEGTHRLENEEVGTRTHLEQHKHHSLIRTCSTALTPSSGSTDVYSGMQNSLEGILEEFADSRNVISQPFSLPHWRACSDLDSHVTGDFTQDVDVVGCDVTRLPDCCRSRCFSASAVTSLTHQHLHHASWLKDPRNNLISAPSGSNS